MDGNNPSTTGKSQEFLWSSLGWRSLSGQDKTYTCAFCKRGFSNAQALGGHMNIHRRDRAKLKLASSLDEECLLSLDIAASKNPIPSDHPAQVSPGNDSPRTESSTTPDGISVIKRPEESFQSIEGENDGKEELQQLPLFVDEKVRNIADGVKEEEMVQLAQDGSSQSQAEAVDLELRLGPEPLENSRKNAD